MRKRNRILFTETPQIGRLEGRPYLFWGDPEKQIPSKKGLLRNPGLVLVLKNRVLLSPFGLGNLRPSRAVIPLVLTRSLPPLSSGPFLICLRAPGCVVVGFSKNSLPTETSIVTSPRHLESSSPSSVHTVRTRSETMSHHFTHSR